jgi:hypothetical protein
MTFTNTTLTIPYSSPSRLTVLTILMTRVSIIDHRALCLYILTHMTSINCQKEFIHQGGLRILRRWIIDAKTSDRVDELITIIRALQMLPVDMRELLRSDLAKEIKLVSKFFSVNHDISSLHTEAKAYMRKHISTLSLPNILI